jgi:hypothetical protein
MAMHNCIGGGLALNKPQHCAAKEAEAILRGPLTRRQKTLAKKRDANEERSHLLQLNGDLLSNVLQYLPGKDLAVLETVCTHFRYGSWVARAAEGAMPEHTAKRKLERMELGSMPPGFRCVCSIEGEKTCCQPQQKPTSPQQKRDEWVGSARGDSALAVNCT